MGAAPVATDEPGIFSAEAAATHGVGARMARLLGSIPTWVLWLIVIIWTVPTIGLFVSSFRPAAEITGSGWWEALLPQNWDQFTLENYDEVLTDSAARPSLTTNLMNSLAIVLPATVIPIGIATIAAYGFAWMDFKGRNWLFVGLIAMMALPNQMTFVPLIQLFVGGASWTIPGTEQTLRLFPDLGINGTAAAVWLTHTSFGLPLAIFLMHNYISQLPSDLFEAARVDGASHFTIFTRLVLPLSRPAIAAFAIFQFLWTWNDFLIAAIFLDGDTVPMTVALVNVVGEQGQQGHLRFPAGFITIVIPLVVFFALQKHFVRGLLAGSVKG